MARIWCSIAAAIAATVTQFVTVSTHAEMGKKFDVIIGAMCLGDLPREARRVIRTIQHGSDAYEDWTLQWDAPPDDARPIIRLFRKVQTSDPSVTCQEMKGDVILSGYIDQIRLTARTSMPGNAAAARIIVEPGGLRLQTGHVSSGLAPLFGGAIDLAGSKAWIENHLRVAIVEGSQPEGALEVTSWARKIQSARLALQNGAPAGTFDLSSGEENVTLLIPLDGSYTELLKGRFVGTPGPVTLDLYDLPSMSFHQVTLDPGQLSIERNRQMTALHLEDSGLTFATAEVTSKRTSVSLGLGTGHIAHITTQISPSADLIAITDARVEKTDLESSNCVTLIGGAPFIKSRHCLSDLAVAERTSVSYRLTASEIGSLGASYLLQPTDTTSATYSVIADASEETFAGKVTEFRAQVGALHFETLHELVMSRASLSATRIQIPIDIDLPNGGGQVVRDIDGSQIILEGQLGQLQFHGTMTLEAGNPSFWRVGVAKGDFAFKACSLVTSAPVVYGGQTQFIGAGIAFQTLTDIQVDQSGASGQVLFAPDVTVVLDPQISLGRSPEGITFKAPARFDAKASFSINLGNGAADVEAGRVSIENAAAVVEPGHPATVGDVKIEDGSIRFSRLQAQYAGGRGHAELSKLEVSAKRLSSVPQSEGGKVADQVSWSGQAQDLLRSDLLAAEVERSSLNGKRLKLERVVIRDTCIAVTDATVGRENAFMVHGESLRVCADIWSDIDLHARFTFRNGVVIGQTDQAEGGIGIPAIDLNITSGPPTRPNGDGRIITRDINVSANTPIPISFHCIGVPDFQPINARTKISAAAAVLGVTLTTGRLRGSGIISFVRGHLQNTSDYDCRGELINWKLWNAVKVKTDVPCPTWSEPLRFCFKEITVIPEGRVAIDSRTRVYFLSADLSAPIPRFAINEQNGTTQLKICAGPFVRGTPLILASYTFQPRTQGCSTLYTTEQGG